MSQTGRVYCIQHKEKYEISYIGSTVKTLNERFQKHKSDFDICLQDDNKKRCSIVKYFKEYGFENFDIFLLKEYQVCDSKHLRVYEQLYINTSFCVNENSACALTKVFEKEFRKKYREDHKEKIKDYLKDYYEENKERISEQGKDYYVKNKEKMNEQCKKYREKNREKLNEQDKKWYQENKEKAKQWGKKRYEENKEEILERQKEYRKNNLAEIKERMSKPYTCICGSIITTTNKSRHNKTTKHKNYIDSNK